jgi:prevent-host-death family protein
MPFAIVLAPEAVEDLRKLPANVRATVRTALETHLRHEPGKISRTRIKRLRGLRRPQFLLRVGRRSKLLRYFRRDRRGSGDRGQVRGPVMARTIRQPGLKEVSLSELRDDLSRFLREAETQEIVITRDGEPAGVLIGFASEDEWADYCLERDPRFLRRIEQARTSVREGRGIRLEDLETE